VPGGWRLSDHYPFSSACDYAQWAIIGTFLGEKGDPRTVAYLLVPLAEAEIVDDWQVLGLLGTGSKSLVLREVFVPEHRHVMVSDLFAGTPPGAKRRWRLTAKCSSHAAKREPAGDGGPPPTSCSGIKKRAPMSGS
jgi:alkylation response protein AidB-like acyl-CoA dehydrogenase